MSFVRNLPGRGGALAVALLLGLAATHPVAAQTAKEAAARLAELEVKVRNEPVTAETLGDVQSISFGSRIAPMVSDEDIALFRFLPRLGSVSLDGLRGVSPVGLKHLVNVPELWRLSLRGSEITDAHVVVVGGLPGVRVLDLTANAAVSDAAMTPILRLPALTDLTLQNTGITDAGLAGLAGHPSLRSLGVGHTAVTDAAFEALGTIPTLQRISLANTAVTGAGFAHIAGLPDLQELGLMNTGVDDAAAVHIGQMAAMRRLFAWNTGLTDAGVAQLTGLGRLEVLYLDRTGLTDAGLAHLAGLPGLRTLWLNATAVGDAGMAHLAGLELTSVQINETAVGDAGLLTLAGIASLTSISARRSAVTEAGVEAALALPGRNPRLNISR